jgi:hypothetical protein
MRGLVGSAFLAPVIAAVLCASACSGASHVSQDVTSTTQRSNRAITLTRVLEQTNRLRSFAYAGTVVLAPTDGGQLTVNVAGTTDVSNHRSWSSFSQSGSSYTETMIVDGQRVFDRLASPPPGGHDWCSENLRTSPGPRVTPISTLANIAKSNRNIANLGPQNVRGTETTHYRVSGDGLPAVEIWVDALDQLRRLRWTHGGDNQTDTTDLFDFNKPVAITLPSKAPPCPGRGNTTTTRP